MLLASPGQVMALYPGDPGPPRADCSGTVLELGDRLRHLRTKNPQNGMASHKKGPNHFTGVEWWCPFWPDALLTSENIVL